MLMKRKKSRLPEVLSITQFVPEPGDLTGNFKLRKTPCRSLKRRLRRFKFKLAVNIICRRLGCPFDSEPLFSILHHVQKTSYVSYVETCTFASYIMV